MEIQEIQITTNSKGETTCGDLGITTSEWYTLLKKLQPDTGFDELLCMLRMPKHKASCKMLSETYGQLPQFYNNKIISFAKWVQKELNRFKVIRPGGEECFWPIPMSKGIEEKSGFTWYLRHELVEALQKIVLEKLIEDFRQKCQLKAFNGYDEAYKWELINKDHNASTPDIIKSLKGINIVSNMHVDGIFKQQLETHPTDFVACVEHLFDETQPLDIRLANYKIGMKKIALPNSKIFANDERTAAGLLTCKYPEKYTVYMNTIYQYVCTYLGIEAKQAGKKYSHYMQIVNGITEQFGEQIQSIIEDEISQFEIKPRILATQTLFWCMQEELKKITQYNIWMVGCYIEKDLHEDFKKEGIWKGQFNDDSESDQDLLDIANTFKKGDIIVLKATGTKGTKHDKSFLRIKGVGILTGDIEFSKTENATIGICPVKYVKTEETDFEGNYYGNYSKSINVLNPKHKDLLKYIYTLLNKNEMNSNYEQYIKLLKANKNLVLTGAPGTGKTYMAQDIAKEMNAETEFVQFHPSYDYTDFVEGLRPIQDKNTGQIGFERKDGVFKSFCKRAAQNLIDSQKSADILEKENDWKSKLWQFTSEAMENATSLHLIKGGHFTITDINDNTIMVYNKENEKTPNISISVFEILELLNEEVVLNNVHDIRDHFKRNFGTQADSYVFVITNAVRKYKSNLKQDLPTIVQRKDFVFIIDEINRGEASKIFGELFYAIDPGYREDLNNILKKDKEGENIKRVQTQYQNLVPETDLFAKGFYVPENVYILATMNDIDRSVESMDFAMRRRFTWKEITPNDTEYMLEGNIDSAILPKAIQKMHRLNAAISEVEELGAAYMIGPSYFLKLKDHDNSFDDLWTLNIEPLLKEYLRGCRKSQELLTKFHNAYLGKEDDNQDANPNE